MSDNQYGSLIFKTLSKFYGNLIDSKIDCCKFCGNLFLWCSFVQARWQIILLTLTSYDKYVIIGPYVASDTRLC